MIDNPRKGVLFQRAVIAAAIVMLLSLLFLGYVAILQPILGNPFIPLGEYSGLEYFDPLVYQQFEKGSLFARQYGSYDFLTSCDVTDFYYRDNQTSDSFLRGKLSDVYALTLDAGTNFESIAEEIRSVGTACGTHTYGGRVYCYFLMPTSGLVSDRFVFCVGDSHEFLRFILLTETDAEDLIIKTDSGDIISTQIIMERILRLSSLTYQTGNNT